MDSNLLLATYRAMLTARRIDLLEQELVNRGEAFFHVSGAGHEASAALAPLLNEDDYLCCHYRDKALAVARGMTAEHFFENLFNKAHSRSAGRQMCAHFTHRRLNIVTMAGPVGNAALHAVGLAQAAKRKAATHGGSPIVLCSSGDGTTQEGEYLESLAEAARDQAPVLFLIQDNRLAISTSTVGRTFYCHETLGRQDSPDSFHGVPIHHIDGRDPVNVYQQLGEVVGYMRSNSAPAIAVMHVERLSNHTNADDHSVYRTEEEVRVALETGDPVSHARKRLIAHGWTVEQCDEIERQVTEEVAAAEAAAYNGPEPSATQTAKAEISVELTHPASERSGEGEPELTMKDAMREVLRHRLQDDSRVVLYGEDIADPKGDVFGVTRGLSTEFGDRVRNSPLSESTIVGTAVGRAMAGERPVAFLQFADFLPLAYNQLVCELGSVFWRSNGEWAAPVIVMVACGGYRAGLGPFHSHSFESAMAHVPGLDVYMPSTAGDAAGLLNTAFETGRPSVFFYPKALLNDSSFATSTDVHRQSTPLAVARKVRVGHDVTLVAWGNGVPLCSKVADALENEGVEAEVLDLRSLSPWDERAVIASAEKTARLIVVHEDNHTCGLGAEVLATVAERSRVPIAMRRVTRADTLVPCNYENQIEVLPSFRRVMTTAAELLDMDLAWTEPAQTEAGCAIIEAIGSGPADEQVTVVELNVEVGQKVTRGEVIGSLEATKSVFEISSPYTGTVEEVAAAEGDEVTVGKPLVHLRVASAGQRRKPVTQETIASAKLTRRRSTERLAIPRETVERRAFDVGMSSVSIQTGSRVVTNAEIVRGRDGFSVEDVVRRTGIETRRWAAANENAIDMAVKACWKLLDQESLLIDDIDVLICSTTSPNAVTPSMACQVLSGIGLGKNTSALQAYDINAACSGYLYALQNGYDYLQSRPDGRVLLVTAEVLSPLLDPNDLDTAILFGDAATATILYGEDYAGKGRARVHRPELSARGEDGSTLSVPFRDAGFIQMKGRKVFTEAVRSMVASLNRACDRQELQVDDLSLVVPHQANQRIIDAIKSRISVDVFSNIRDYGNTSSSSIPLCLAEVLPTVESGQRMGLCAFGGGFTFGASILET